MYSQLQLGLKYLNYYLSASNGKGHGMHSPFVFDFIKNVLNNAKGFHPPAEIQRLRNELEKDNTELVIADLGAGSRKNQMNKRKVGEIAKNAVKPKKYGELMYRLVAHYEPASVVELGTSLGITTAYMASAQHAAKVFTIEGAPPVAGIAAWNFQRLGLNNIELRTGNFDAELPELLSGLKHVDLGYIDGNHRYGPTMEYFGKFLKKVHNDSIIVMDDIHWSAEMEQAWSEVKADSRVRCTIDLFFMGFVFFRDEFKAKQDHVIRF